MNTRMRSISVIALVSALVLLAVSVVPVMAQAQASTPYVINGYVFYADGSECKGPVVSVTNTPAENDTNSNYYELVLDSSKVSVGDVLQFNARDPGGTQENAINHTVTQAEMDNGGLFDFNITLHPPPIPDLVITDKFETLADDGTFTVNYTVANIGDGEAGASTTSITMSDGQGANDSVPALAAGDSYTSTISGFNCPCGTTITVTVCADSTSVVDESNETNNCLSNELKCLPCGLPDLEITHVWFEVGDHCNWIKYNIINNGDAEAGRSVSNLTVDGNVTKKRDGVKPLAIGENRTESFRYSKRLGIPSTIMVCANCGKNPIPESNETNNCGT